MDEIILKMGPVVIRYSTHFFYWLFSFWFGVKLFFFGLNMQVDIVVTSVDTGDANGLFFLFCVVFIDLILCVSVKKNTDISNAIDITVDVDGGTRNLSQNVIITFNTTGGNVNNMYYSLFCLSRFDLFFLNILFRRSIVVDVELVK